MILGTLNFYLRDWSNFIVRRIPDTIRNAVTGVPYAQLIIHSPKTVENLKELESFIVKRVNGKRGKKSKKGHITVVDLEWPAALLLVLENDQPTHRKKLSSKLLEYKLKNDTPFLIDDVACAMLETQKGFHLCVAIKKDIIALQERLKRQQITLRDILSQSAMDQNTLFSFRDLLSRPKKTWVRANLTMCALLFVILTAQIGYNFYGIMNEKASIQNEISTLQSRALVYAKEISGLNDGSMGFDVFYEALDKEPKRIFILNAINDALDDGTWLMELKLQKNKLQLVGTTRSDAEELLEAFGKIDGLGNLKLSSQAQSSNRTQESRFSIEADVK